MDTELQRRRKRIEAALQRGIHPETVCALFRLPRSEIEDMFPDYFTDEPEPDRNATSGY